MAILGEEGNKLVSVLFLACGDVNTILDFDNSFSRLSEMTVHTPTQKIENMQTVWFATNNKEVMVAKLEVKKVDLLGHDRFEDDLYQLHHCNHDLHIPAPQKKDHPRLY